MVTLGGFRLPSIPTADDVVKQVTCQEGSKAITTPVGGLFTGTNIVTKTVAPHLAGKITGLAMLGGGALAGYVLGSMGGGQEQTQELSQGQQVVSEANQSTSNTFINQPTTIHKTVNEVYNYQMAGGDIYGAPVSIYTGQETSNVPSQSSGGQYAGASGSQDQSAEQKAFNMDSTSLLILAAVGIGAYLLFKRD